MARIAGQELDFGGAVEGFLTHFAAGLANDPTRQALKQYHAEQAVKHEDKVRIINNDILPYLDSLPEQEKDVVKEKLLAKTGPSYSTVAAIGSGLAKGTFVIGTESQRSQPGVLENTQYTSWGNTGLIIGKKGLKKSLEEQRLEANIKVKSLINSLKEERPDIVNDSTLFKQEVRKIYQTSLTEREKALNREYLFGTSKASAEMDLRLKIGTAIGVFGKGTQGEAVIAENIRRDQKYRGKSISWLLQNHPQLNNQYSSMLFGIMDMNPKVMAIYSEASQTAQAEHQLQKDSISEEIAEIATADTSDKLLNKFLEKQAEGLQGTSPNDVLNAPLFQPAALEQIIRSRPPGRDPEEYTDELMGLVTIAIPNIREDVFNEIKEILRERLEKIRS